MSKQDQLFTGSFHGSTSEEHETYHSEPMIPMVTQLTALTTSVVLPFEVLSYMGPDSQGAW